VLEGGKLQPTPLYNRWRTALSSARINTTLFAKRQQELLAKRIVIMASHFQEDFIANKGDDMGPAGTTHVQPKGVDVSQPHSSGNELGGSEMVDRASANGNPVLEEHAQTKGSWFAYLKTKQFWVALLLGQGMFHSVAIPLGCEMDIVIRERLTRVYSTGDLRHVDEYVDVAS
jgi:hypothetical protein